MGTIRGMSEENTGVEQRQYWVALVLPVFYLKGIITQCNSINHSSLDHSIFLHYRGIKIRLARILFFLMRKLTSTALSRVGLTLLFLKIITIYRIPSILTQQIRHL